MFVTGGRCHPALAVACDATPARASSRRREHGHPAGQRRETGRARLALLIIANLRAARATDLQAPVQLLRDSADARVTWPESPERMAGPLEAAVGEARTVVVAGGDGTVHAVLQRLWHLDLLGRARIGLVPYGAANDLARSVGIPLEPTAAAKVVLSGVERPLDIAADDSGAVIANAALLGPGAGAGVRGGRREPRLFRRLRWVGAATSAAPSGKRLAIELDGSPLWSGKAFLVALGVGPAAGGAPLCAHAALDDGLLDVVVIPASPFRLRLAAAWRAPSGGHLGVAGVVHGRGRQVSVCGDPVVSTVDGEPPLLAPPRSFTLHPRAWRLIVPGP